MRKTERTLYGAVRLEISGAQPEALLNAAAAEGLRLSELESLDPYTLRLTVREGEGGRLEELARRCHCELRLLSRRGGSAARRLLRRRGALLLMAAATAVLLLLSSLFVWEVELVGGERLSRGRVLRALADCGVAPGCFWPGLDSDRVRSRMLRQLPELAWVAVNARSSRATVLLLERQEKPEIYREGDGADIVAARTGIVRRLTVLNGRALVQPGQAVTAGETLVSGSMDSPGGAPRLLRARAEIWADTWYELTALCPLESAGKTGEGRRTERFALKIGQSRFNFYGNSGNPLDGCDKIVHEYKLGVEGLFRLPVSLVREELIRRAPQPAGPAAAEELQRHLLEGLAARIDGEIVSAAFTVSESGGLLRVTLRARCWENIAQTVNITT